MKKSQLCVIRKNSSHCKTNLCLVWYHKPEGRKNCTTYPMKSFCIGGILLLTNQPEDTTSLSIWSPHLKIYRSFRDEPRPERHDLSLAGNSEVSVQPRSRCSLWKEVRCCGKVRGQNHLGRWKVQLQLK